MRFKVRSTYKRCFDPWIGQRLSFLWSPICASDSDIKDASLMYLIARLIKMTEKSLVFTDKRHMWHMFVGKWQFFRLISTPVTNQGLIRPILAFLLSFWSLILERIWGDESDSVNDFGDHGWKFCLLYCGAGRCLLRARESENSRATGGGLKQFLSDSKYDFVIFCHSCVSLNWPGVRSVVCGKGSSHGHPSHVPHVPSHVHPMVAVVTHWTCPSKNVEFRLAVVDFNLQINPP